MSAKLHESGQIGKLIQICTHLANSAASSIQIDGESVNSKTSPKQGGKKKMSLPHGLRGVRTQLRHGVNSVQSALAYDTSQRRHYSWNPFKRSPTLEQPQQDEIPAELVELRRQLRPDGDLRSLSSVLKSLQSMRQNAHSFTTMNEVIKMLDRLPVQQEGIIPGLTVSECLDLYLCVTSVITRENYQSARFIPRLYLQLMKYGENTRDVDLVKTVFEQFIRYLMTLGFEDQALKILKGFNEQSLVSRSEIVDSLASVLQQDVEVHPSLIMGILTVFSDQRLVSSGINKALKYLENRNILFAIDSKDLEAIGYLIDTVSTSQLNSELIKNTLKICEFIGREFPEKEKKLLQIIQTNKISEEDEALRITERALINGCSVSDAQIWLSKMNQFPQVNLAWSVFLNGLQDVPEDLVNESTLNLLVLATINSNESQLPRVIEFFNDALVNMTNETFEIIFKKYIATRSYSLLEKSFEDSLLHGVDWTNNKILYDFFITLASQPDADVKQIFQLSKKVKIYLTHLDAESYSCLMRLILQNELIADALASFKQELPPLENDLKYTMNNYPSLYSTILNWCLRDSVYPADVHKLYTVFTERFIFPNDYYFPLIKRLTEMHRPDFAFQIFQDMKRLHRTTGSIPPPAPEVYIHLFKSFGHELYSDGVETLDAIYKTDLTINSSIPLLNSILDAYTSLQNFEKVSQTYQKIVGHPQGPDNETVSIMLKAHSLLSLDNVKDFWNNLDEIGILPDEDNYRRYLIAHCYHGEDKLALGIAKTIEDMDLTVSEDILKTLYQWSSEKDEVEKWAQLEHDDIWKKVENEVKSLVKVKEDVLEPGMTLEELKLIRT